MSPRLIIPALAVFGQGRRLSALEPLGGRSLLDRLLRTTAPLGLGAPLILLADQDLAEVSAVVGDRAVLQGVGVERCRRTALSTALETCREERLLIHDAERALTPAETIREVLAVTDAPVAAPCIDVTDSVKRVTAQGLQNVDRAGLATVQSPRLFQRGALRTALEKWSGDEIASALEAGLEVRGVPGSHSGFAVTDRLSLWQAQISLGLSRDTTERHGLGRRH